MANPSYAVPAAPREFTAPEQQAVNEIHVRELRASMPPVPLRSRIVDIRRIKAGPIHTHICACGDYFVCRAEPDQCAVIDPYQCDNCAQDQRDAYLSEQEAKRGDVR